MAHAAAARAPPPTLVSTRARRGCRGKRRRLRPRGVTRPSCTAPRRASRSRACRSRSGAGASYQSKWKGSPPQPSTSNSAFARSIRCTSGSRWGRRRSLGSQRRTAVPGPVRPARPARCSAESQEMRSVSRRSIPFSGSKRRTLCSPASTTSVTPSMVSEVSAMLVARMTFRSSLSARAASCSRISRLPWSGNTLAGRDEADRSRATSRISLAPGRKQRTWRPGAARRSRTATAADWPDAYRTSTSCGRPCTASCTGHPSR